MNMSLHHPRRHCRFVSPEKVLFLDLDGTLAVGKDATEEDCPGVQIDRSVNPAWPNHSGTTDVVRAAIKKAKREGYEVSIVTAESGEEALNSQQLKFLRSIDPEVFTDEFLFSPLFQHACSLRQRKINCWTEEINDKPEMVMNVFRYLGIPKNKWHLSVFVDDNLNNLAEVAKLGLQVVQASANCGGRLCTQGCGVPLSVLGILKSEPPQRYPEP